MKISLYLLWAICFVFFAPLGQAAFHLEYDLDEQGFELLGVDAYDETGSALAVLDIDGDGYSDLVIGAPNADGTGLVYIVYGKSDFGAGDPLELDFLGSDGVTVQGEALDDLLGQAVACVGDLNGDNRDDLLIGAPGYNGAAGSATGRCYLILGKEKSAFPETLNLADPGAADLILDGSVEYEAIGSALAFAGEFSGSDDPLAFLIGAPLKDTAATLAGAAYLVYWDASLVGTMTLDAVIGLGKAAAFEGALFLENAGTAVSGDFDYNGDGFSDIVIGAPGADYGAYNTAGRAYLVLGSDAIRTGTFDLETLHVNEEAVAFDGASNFEQAGASVLGIKNSYDDPTRFDTVVIAAPIASPSEIRSGRIYIVQGTDTIAYSVALDSLGPDGTTLNGVELQAGNLGISLADLGDVNDDGNGDFAFGTAYTSPEGQSHAGTTFVSLGSRFMDDAEDFDARVPMEPILIGAKVGDLSGRALAGGDVNGDGLNDLLIGAPGYFEDLDEKIGRAHFIAGTPTLMGTLGNNLSFMPYMDARGDFTPESAEGFDVIIQIDTSWSSHSPPLIGYVLLGYSLFNDPGASYQNIAVWPRISEPGALIQPIPFNAGTGIVQLEDKVVPADVPSGAIFYAQVAWPNPANPQNWAASNAIGITIP